MNPKIEKVNGEIEQTKTKVAKMQAHLRELERKKTELEDADIVAMFRKENLTEDAFAAFVRQMSSRSDAEKETVNEYQPDVR